MNNDPLVSSMRCEHTTYRLPWAILAAAAAIHLGLLIYDIYHPDVFLRVDRSLLRLERISELGNTSSFSGLVAYLGSHGLLGDYALHALLLSAGGRVMLICAQILLLLWSAIAVFRLSETLRLPRTACQSAILFYLLLPHSLVFPHQLSSEAIYVPLLVLSTWQTVLGFNRQNLYLLLYAALALGLATLIRPVTLLWPVIAGLALGWKWRPAHGMYFVAAALLPVFLWMTLVWRVTGDFSLGESSASMDRNLYQRVRLISRTMPDDTRAKVEATYLNQGDRGKIGTVDYLSFGFHHPGPFAEHLGRDFIAFFLKSGVERLTIDYFGNGESFRTLQEDQRGGWRGRLDQDGPLAAIAFLWKSLGGILLVSVIGVLFMIGWLFFAASGSLRLALHATDFSREKMLSGTLLVLMPIYVFTISQVADAMQSRLRAPCEFALVILGVYGIASFRKGTSNTLK